MTANHYERIYFEPLLYDEKYDDGDLTNSLEQLKEELKSMRLLLADGSKQHQKQHEQDIKRLTIYTIYISMYIHVFLLHGSLGLILCVVIHIFGEVSFYALSELYLAVLKKLLNSGI